MKQIVTGDKSITFHSDEFDETYHSVSGAVEEAFKKFAEPALEAVKGKDFVRVLDICFGLGYNSAAILDKVLEEHLGCEVEIVGLENDEKILDKIKELKPMIKTYYVIQDAVANQYFYDCEGIMVKILVCDALKGIKQVQGKFDIILHDPFSPKKCPELWTEEFFKEIRKKISDDGILTTYSCAGVVRENLKKAGFKVEDGPCVGRKAPSTIARPGAP
ncbi:MAG: hypothetical protein KKF46_03750 [Nanoarchaeota archaeon]|nr:hypothetical protein [Nanoarchaeota archaeon]MBU1321448.1 hypothetical protein [Nanoarchaeota archaeon]MBU1596904.1 hypothetical protein [Nanoarchaeota archaeon]MBU2441559.1 hypothetical protein [Nanoarchaeota archaeon]